MKPIKQTTYYGGGKNHGNCVQAAVASILEIDLDEVPHFLLFGHSWDKAVACFMRSKGKKYGGIYKPEEWSKMKTINGYYLAVGLSPRGVYHCCVYKDGKLAHDPHKNEGDIIAEYIYSFY